MVCDFLNDLSVKLQPVVCLDKGRIHSYECLLRLHTKQLRLNGKELLAKIRNTPAMNLVESFTVNELVSVGLELEKTGVHEVSINIEPSSFFDEKFINRMVVLLKDSYGKGNLCFELNSSIFYNPIVSQSLTDLRAIGIKVAADNFMPQHASYLAMPLDYIKLNYSLVNNIHNNPNARLNVKNILHKATVLGVKVIAVGVENACEDMCLKELGIKYAQGFYYAKPLHKEHFGINDNVADEIDCTEIEIMSPNNGHWEKYIPTFYKN